MSFKSQSSLKEVQKFPFHIIEGKRVEIKICEPFDEELDSSNSKEDDHENTNEQPELVNPLFSISFQSKKIFLGGLAPTVDESKIFDFLNNNLIITFCLCILFI